MKLVNIKKTDFIKNPVVLVKKEVQETYQIGWRIIMKKMTTWNQLTREFDKKVDELQKSCPHKKSKWYDECWAIAHYTGKQVKVCLRCNKVLEKK